MGEKDAKDRQKMEQVEQKSSVNLKPLHQWQCRYAHLPSASSAAAAYPNSFSAALLWIHLRKLNKLLTLYIQTRNKYKSKLRRTWSTKRSQARASRQEGARDAKTLLGNYI
jgi:hypothetical protein